MKKIITCVLLCAIALVMLGCKDPISQNPDDTPNIGGEITPNPGDEQEYVDFDVTYTETFTEGEREDSDYSSLYTNGFGSTGVALSATGMLYSNHIVLSGHSSYSCNIEVVGIKGLGTVTIKYESWTKNETTKGDLNLFVDGSLVETLEHYRDDSKTFTHVFEVNNSNTTSFILRPTVGAANNSEHRIRIYDVTWTTTK